MSNPEDTWRPFEGANCDGFVHLFNVSSKADLEKYCRDFVVRRTDLVMWIMIVRSGGLDGYCYANRFKDSVPPHLHPTEEERQAIGQNGLGPLEGKAKKAASKISQIFVERRYFCAHLFYTRCRSYWFLFYFDQRDIMKKNNHWKHGPHIHLLSHLWPNLQLDAVWQKILKGDTNFASKLHLRYLDIERENPFEQRSSG